MVLVTRTVSYESGDERVKSTVRKKDLNPVWVESFELPNSDKDAKVVFEVLDYDAYGTSDPIGRFALPFLALSDRKLMRRWFVLKDQAGQKQESSAKSRATRYQPLLARHRRGDLGSPTDALDARRVKLGHAGGPKTGGKCDKSTRVSRSRHRGHLRGPTRPQIEAQLDPERPRLISSQAAQPRFRARPALRHGW